MKRLFLLLVLVFLAPSITDQLDTQFMLGTHTDTQNISNTITLAQSGGNYTLSGFYVSNVKDLGSNPTATILWSPTLPAQTSLIVTTRGGNVPVPDGTWSAWSLQYNDQAGSLVSSPTRRYYQYRLQLTTLNNQVTPEVDSVTFTYAEQGAVIAVAPSQNDDLDSEYAGAYRFHVTISDTLALTSTQARYSIDGQAYSAYENLTLNAGYYYLDIPEPGGGWSAFSGEDLDVEVVAVNANTVTNETFTVLIQHVNQPPAITSLASRTLIEGQQTTIAVSGSDPDADALTFSSTHGSVTSTSSTGANIVWTPDAGDIGVYNVTVTVSDGQLTAETNFTATVLAFNYPPVMRAIIAQSGHYGDRITFEVVVDDVNTDENMTYWVEPRLFTVESQQSNTSGVYRAQASFIALDDHRGTTNITFYASDGEHTAFQTALLDITYCGDDVCQAQENASSCSRDCAQRTMPSYVVLEVPDRFCINQTAVLSTFNASSRYSCYFDGRAYQGAAYCDVFSGSGITIFELTGQQRQQVQTLTTNSTGQAEFTPLTVGRYRILAESSDMVSMDQMVTVNDCSLDINEIEQVVEYERPNLPAPARRPPQLPQVERPELTPEQTSLLAILVWYVVIPLLGAALLYTGTTWYDLNKNDNVYLLAWRVQSLELQKLIEPYVMPPLRKMWHIISPVVEPIMLHVYNNVFVPTIAFVVRLYRNVKP